MQRVQHRDRRGVVVPARGTDVVGEQPEVEIPTLRWRAAGADALDSTRREAHGREPGRHAETLLRARIHGVDAPAVDVDGDAAERRDGVDQQQRVGLLELGERRDLVLDAGRRLGVHDREYARVRMCVPRVKELVRIDRVTPGGLDAHDLGAAPARDLAHPLAEHAVDADDRGVARLEQVDEACLHPGRSGSADRQGERVARAEHRAQTVGDLVEHDEEVGIEMPEHRPLERLHHLRIRIRRPGPEQQSISMRHTREASDSRCAIREAAGHACG